MRTIKGLKGLSRARRGLDGLIVAIILIVIAIVIGGVVYGYTQHLIGANQVNAALEITGYSLSAPAGGTAYLQVTVQNTGSLALSNIVINLGSLSSTAGSGGTPTLSCSNVPSQLAPGQSFSTVCTISSGVTAGNEYPLYVTANAGQSSVSSPVINLIAQG